MARARLLALCVAAAAFASCSTATSEPSPTHYFYYLHGRIVEDLGSRGVSPRHGAYDYPGVIEALRAEGLEVVSEVRPKDTDPSAYADQVVADIRARLRSGVPPERITVRARPRDR